MKDWAFGRFQAAPSSRFRIECKAKRVPSFLRDVCPCGGVKDGKPCIPLSVHTSHVHTFKFGAFIWCRNLVLKFHWWILASWTVRMLWWSWPQMMLLDVIIWPSSLIIRDYWWNFGSVTDFTFERIFGEIFWRRNQWEQLQSHLVAVVALFYSQFTLASLMWTFDQFMWGYTFELQLEALAVSGCHSFAFSVVIADAVTIFGGVWRCKCAYLRTFNLQSLAVAIIWICISVVWCSCTWRVATSLFSVMSMLKGVTSCVCYTSRSYGSVLRDRCVDMN